MVRSFHTNPAASEMSVAVVAVNQSLKNSDKRVANARLDKDLRSGHDVLVPLSECREQENGEHRVRPTRGGGEHEDTEAQCHRLVPRPGPKREQDGRNILGAYLQ
jgi:hypothetical protein